MTYRVEFMIHKKADLEEGGNLGERMAATLTGDVLSQVGDLVGAEIASHNAELRTGDHLTICVSFEPKPALYQMSSAEKKIKATLLEGEGQL